MKSSRAIKGFAGQRLVYLGYLEIFSLVDGVNRSIHNVSLYTESVEL